MNRYRKKALKRSSLRDVKRSFGRFFAIFAIIALGVGFFSGVRITTPTMVRTFNEFYDEKHFFDYRLVSTVGWDDKDLEAVRNRDLVIAAEGCFQYDVILNGKEGDELVFKAHSMPDQVNQLLLQEGRFPETPEEVLLDNKNRHDFKVGDTITIAESNTRGTKAHFRNKELKVVGFADSSLYINFERGSTSLGNGLVDGFLYLTKDGFKEKIYTDIYVDLDVPGDIYSDEYNDRMDELRDDWDSFLDKQAEKRMKRAAFDPDNMLLTFWSMFTSEEEDAMTADAYLLERNTNIGYACFENDSAIVEQIARVFPIFFILVAALVCMTTMTRMVEEQRGQIGILKALGYSNKDIVRKYTGYSGSAAMFGCVFGYSVGIFLFPGVIWITYHLMYINLALSYYFDWQLALIGLLVSVACSAGITLIACRYELMECAAELMRPKAPKPGKRVFLEHVPVIWNRLKFLHKVSVRNIFRYKGRFLMMIVGISGCTALLLTGLGLKDSIADFSRLQFEEIQLADLEVSFKHGTRNEMPESLKNTVDSMDTEYVLFNSASWDLISGKTVKSVQLLSPQTKEDSTDFRSFFHLETLEGEEIALPKPGELLICISLADRYDLSVGDEVTLRSENMREVPVKIAGIFRNHVYNYAIANDADIKGDLNTAYLKFPAGTDVFTEQTKLSEIKDVININVYETMKERFTKMLDSLNYIVLIVILSAAGLAFVVLYNLTNINITERIREIATIKVLGFYPNETAQYIFRENYVLTFFGMLAGLGLGVLLHRFVMAQIIVDMVYFNKQIKPLSFALGVILTFLFAFLVSLFMRRKLERINMAESLKSVE